MKIGKAVSRKNSHLHPKQKPWCDKEIRILINSLKTLTLWEISEQVLPHRSVSAMHKIANRQGFSVTIGKPALVEEIL